MVGRKEGVEHVVRQTYLKIRKIIYFLDSEEYYAFRIKATKAEQIKMDKAISDYDLTSCKHLIDERVKKEASYEDWDIKSLRNLARNLNIPLWSRKSKLELSEDIRQCGKKK